MTSTLDLLWQLMDLPEPIVTAHAVAAWPAGVHQRLLELGFLIRTADADRVLCPECGGHWEEVIASDGPGGTVRFCVPCPEVSRALVPASDRFRWTCNVEGVVSALAAALQLTGAHAELMRGRVWRLGRTVWRGAMRDVVLALGMGRNDASTVCSTIQRSRIPIVFVSHAKPSDEHWRGRVPPILALSQVATLADLRIEVDSLEFAAAIHESEERRTEPTVLSLNQLKLLIRQQVKAEGKASLTDDVFEAAYRQHGSLRDAAAYLSRETGQEVTKDRVHRALLRVGGVAAVLDAQDSDSVVRTRPSSRGRKSKKPTHPNT